MDHGPNLEHQALVRLRTFLALAEFTATMSSSKTFGGAGERC